MIGQTRTKERPQYDDNTTAFTEKNELLSEEQNVQKATHLYQDFLSNLIAMDLLGNANNYTASANVITLIKMDQAYKLCYIFSYSSSSEFSGITHNAS